MVLLWCLSILSQQYFAGVIYKRVSDNYDSSHAYLRSYILASTQASILRPELELNLIHLFLYQKNHLFAPGLIQRHNNVIANHTELN